MAHRIWQVLPNRYIPRHNTRRVIQALLCGFIPCITVIGVPAVGLAQENPSKEASATSNNKTDVASASQTRHAASSDELNLWIDQLGSPLFHVREQAVRLLSKCDASAVTSLREAANRSSDPEVKSRCLAIANAIFEQDVGKRSREFLKDPDPEKTYGFEGWLPFSEIVGKNRLAKRLFADMLAANPNQAISKPASSADVATSLQRDASEIFNKFRTRQEVQLSDSVSLLYRTIQLNGEVPAGVEQVIVFLMRSAPLTVEISRPPMRLTLQRLIGSWMKVTKSDPSNAMMIALDHEIPEGAEIARRVLSNPDCDPSRYMMSISTLMRFGDGEDVSILKSWCLERKLIQKEINVQVWPPKPIPDAAPNPNEQQLELGPRLAMPPPMEIKKYELRYQDLALAASAHLQKREDMKDLFPRLQTHPNYVFRPESLALPQADDDARQRLIDALATEPAKKEEPPKEELK